MKIQEQYLLLQLIWAKSRLVGEPNYALFSHLQIVCSCFLIPVEQSGKFFGTFDLLFGNCIGISRDMAMHTSRARAVHTAHFLSHGKAASRFAAVLATQVVHPAVKVR